MIFRALKLSCLAVGLFAVASVAQAQPMPGGLNVQQAGTTIVFGATTLNFSSGCTVTSSGIGTASAACTGGGATGVSSFNTRTGAVTFTNGDLTSVLSSADIIAALGYTPAATPTVRQITSGTTDTVLSTDGFIAWDSPTNGAKVETVGAGTAGKSVTFKDEYGNAGTTGNYITLTASGCTIDGQTTFPLNINLEAVRLTWDGVSNWMVN